LFCRKGGMLEGNTWNSEKKNSKHGCVKEKDGEGCHTRPLKEARGTARTRCQIRGARPILASHINQLKRGLRKPAIRSNKPGETGGGRKEAKEKKKDFISRRVRK